MLHSIRTSHSSHPREFHRGWEPVHNAANRSRDFIGCGGRCVSSPSLDRNRGDSVHVSAAMVASSAFAGIAGGVGVLSVGSPVFAAGAGVSAAGLPGRGTAAGAGEGGEGMRGDPEGAGAAAGWREGGERATGVGGGGIVVAGGGVRGN